MEADGGKIGAVKGVGEGGGGGRMELGEEVAEAALFLNSNSC